MTCRPMIRRPDIARLRAAYGESPQTYQRKILPPPWSVWKCAGVSRGSAAGLRSARRPAAIRQRAAAHRSRAAPADGRRAGGQQQAAIIPTSPHGCRRTTGPTGPRKELAPQFRRTQVNYNTREPVGTIIVDTQNTYLYLVLGNGKAMRYGIGVGREGFTWGGPSASPAWRSGRTGTRRRR